MTIEAITKEILSYKGNFCRRKSDIFISPLNMRIFVKRLEACDDIPETLITPYLLNTKDGKVYELLYYEFLFEMCDVPKSCFIEFPSSNILSEEIVNNIKPRAFFAKNDKEFLISTLLNYLEKMDGMTFEDEKKPDDFFENASLFYQIF